MGKDGRKEEEGRRCRDDENVLHHERHTMKGCETYLDIKRAFKLSDKRRELGDDGEGHWVGAAEVFDAVKTHADITGIIFALIVD